MRKVIIAAVASNGIIGKSGEGIPWNVREEIEHFKNSTIGYPVIFGRKTFETLSKPLIGRLIIVLSKNAAYNPVCENVLLFNSLIDSINYCQKKGYEKIFIAGGGKIYSEAINLADELLISLMDFEVDGDISFPAIDKLTWYENNRERKELFEIVHFKRKS